MHALPALAKRAKSSSKNVRQPHNARHDAHAASAMGTTELQQQEATVEGLLAEWTELQRQTCEAQLHLLQEMFEAHRKKLEGLIEARVSTPDDVAALHATEDPKLLIAAPLKSNMPGQEQLSVAPARTATAAADEPAAKMQSLSTGTSAEVGNDLQAFNEEFGDLDEDDGALEWWKRSSGMHTVKKWLANYRKHPAGWGALLMIHGIPEVTGRLRSKVENYAIYSALFLSVSMGLLIGPPDYISSDCGDELLELSGFSYWECEVQQRMYHYLLEIGTAAHMLSILLSMSFINVLNEAARDSDIIRMFARGKGFVATVKVQRAFVVGCLADFMALIVAGKVCTGWDTVALAGVLAGCSYYTLRQTADLLYKSGSIVRYWRPELGGKPDADDPYELKVPLAAMERRAAAAERATAGGFFGSK